ncbi:prepilin peptidase [Paludibacterium yongneupense]|uniref:prepilin peptidase n=1 Tax=Paludibacterium yongneupense TaxID=400061 RepID=UPI00042A30B7|nr:A24 family peptidase [Paludibacterium yongneupense]
MEIAALALSMPLRLLLAAVLGLMAGSFLNVVVYRLPRMGEANARYNLAWPPSHCPQCRERLRAWQIVPVLSFLLLRGRCAYCGVAISWRYPLIELLAALAFVVVAWRAPMPLELCAGWILSAVLLALAAIDWREQVLPDALTLPLLWAGLLLNPFLARVPLYEAVTGAAAGYAVLWLVYWGFRLATGREGLGYGDFKLLAALGAWLGWHALPLVILLSSMAGVVVGGLLMVRSQLKLGQPMPFGPFLAVAGWLAWVWGDAIMSWYWYG